MKKTKQRKKNKHNAGTHPEESYETATIKNLMLDRPTSHGGWPDGHPGGFTDKKRPVHVQIADYLKSMGLLEVEEDIVLSEQKLRQIIRKVLLEAYN